MQRFYGYAATRRDRELWDKLVIAKMINKLPIKWSGTELGFNNFDHLTRLSNLGPSSKASRLKVLI